MDGTSSYRGHGSSGQVGFESNAGLACSHRGDAIMDFLVGLCFIFRSGYMSGYGRIAWGTIYPDTDK